MTEREHTFASWNVGDTFKDINTGQHFTVMQVCDGRITATYPATNWPTVPTKPKKRWFRRG
jgi:hypothetical protein